MNHRSRPECPRGCASLSSCERPSPCPAAASSRMQPDPPGSHPPRDDVVASDEPRGQATGRAKPGSDHASVDVGFRTVERQRRVAAMVLAGGIAYRIFFWLLAVSVVVGGVLGLLDLNAVQSALEKHGLAGWTASAVADVTPVRRRATSGGCSSSEVGCALDRATRAARRSPSPTGRSGAVDPRRIDRPLHVSLLFTGSAFGFIAAMAAARYVRESGRYRRVRRDDARPRRRVRLLARVVPHSLPNSDHGLARARPGSGGRRRRAPGDARVHRLLPRPEARRAPHSSTASWAS